ncbi:MAG: hydroxymethylglutaryl-CoA lyase [Burkholderiales bacterium]|nr:hydroxymethylglutaryl-CoA lyase [Burkholderiales bacterium]
MKYPSRVSIVEVGARDGLQNEKQEVAAALKIELVNRLSEAGFRNVEAGSFVSPKWVPQMATSPEVMAGIVRKPGVIYSVLTPNMKGFESALVAKADEVVIFGAASEAFSQKNINCSIAESIERFRPVAEAAKANGMRVRAAISCALGCPYQGEVPIASVVDCVKRFADLGCDDIGIADTIGVGTPARASAVFEAAAMVYPLAQLSAHFHDTYGQACANVLACLELGVSTFDTSVAGLGGCPYAKGATGNVATEDVLYMLHGMGIETGIDLDLVCDAGQFISQALGRAPHSRVNRALAARRAG